MAYQDKNEARVRAVSIVRSWLERDPIFLDTETTGVDNSAQICDLALIGVDGKILLDTLIRPTIQIPAVVVAIHGISNEAVREAPSFAEVFEEAARLIGDRLVVAYNMDFDNRMMVQSAKAHGIEIAVGGESIACAMLAYAQFRGEWNGYRRSWKWHKLALAAKQCGIAIPSDLHRARVDAELARKVTMYMAEVGA